MSYEILLEQREPIDGWTVCTVCLSVERTAAIRCYEDQQRLNVEHRLQCLMLL